MGSASHAPYPLRSPYLLCLLGALMQVPMSRQKRRIPITALFHHAALGGIIDIDDTEAFIVAFSPLEIIYQRPHKVSAQGNPLLDSFAQPLDVGAQKFNAPGVADRTVSVPRILKGRAILCDIDFLRGIRLMQIH